MHRLLHLDGARRGGVDDHLAGSTGRSAPRSSSGSLSRRIMWVGTSCTWVTRWRSMAAEAARAGRSAPSPRRCRRGAACRSSSPPARRGRAAPGSGTRRRAVKPNRPVEHLGEERRCAEGAGGQRRQDALRLARWCPRSRTSSRPRARRAPVADVDAGHDVLEALEAGQVAVDGDAGGHLREVVAQRRDHATPGGPWPRARWRRSRRRCSRPRRR